MKKLYSNSSIPVTRKLNLRWLRREPSHEYAMVIQKTLHKFSVFSILSFFTFLMLVPAMAKAGNELMQFGTALRGYDVVAYQTENKAIEGVSNHAVHHHGLTYLFASKANADMFKANPSKYKPAYGGYCALGVTAGMKLPTDPQAFTVVDGVLYMNFNKRAQERWMQDIPGNIEIANAKWQEIKDIHPNKLR